MSKDSQDFAWSTELDAADVAAIEESEEQIARGEDLNWSAVSQELRRRFLDEGPNR